MLTRRVDLTFPIELPGGTISTVVARPLTAEDFRLMSTSPEANLRAFSNCVRLPVNVVHEMDDADHAVVVDAIAKLTGETQAAYLALQRGRFTVLDGGRE